MASQRDFTAVTSELQRAAADRPAATARNIRWLEDQLTAIERGEFESLLRDAHDDVTFDIFAPGKFPFVTTARGKRALLDATAHNFASVEDQQPRIDDIFAEGDTLVLFGREGGKIRETGALYSVEFVQRLTFRDGRLAAVRIIVAETA